MNKIKKILDIASTVAVVLFVAFVVLLVGVRIIGIEPHIVLSGSMEPEILTGSLVYVKPITREEACELKEGETITYLVDSKGTKVTHKIYEVVGPAYVKNQRGELVLDENGEPTVAKDDKGYPIIMYVTYGINNSNKSDPSGFTLDGKPGEGNLASSNVFGKPVFSIPLLGYVAHFVQNPPGKYLAIGLCILLVASSIFSGFFEKEKSKNEAVEASANGAEPPKEEKTSEDQENADSSRDKDGSSPD